MRLEWGAGYPESQLVCPSEDSEPRPLHRTWQWVGGSEPCGRTLSPPTHAQPHPLPCCFITAHQGLLTLTWGGPRSPGKPSGPGSRGAPSRWETVCRQSSQWL